MPTRNSSTATVLVMWLPCASLCFSVRMAWAALAGRPSRLFSGVEGVNLSRRSWAAPGTARERFRHGPDVKSATSGKPRLRACGQAGILRGRRSRPNGWRNAA